MKLTKTTKTKSNPTGDIFYTNLVCMLLIQRAYRWKFGYIQVR